jgi:hypothetical protein
MKPEKSKLLKIILLVFIPILLLGILAAWISVFTRWNAMFYFAALFVIGLPTTFGLSLVRASKEKMREDVARSSKLLFATPPEDASRQERFLFGWRRFLGWSALIFAAFVLFEFARAMLFQKP